MKHQNRIIIAGMLGNLVEAFDMAICGLLSVYLAKYLIGDIKQGLLIVFVTFFAGYIARPLGALCLGLFSDVYGRKITLAASILSMGIATALIGFIPSNGFINISSVEMLLILRIIQSFSCGAEYLNSSAYLVENADEHRQGFSGSWVAFGAMSGLLLASIVAMIVTRFTLSYPKMEWLIWRIPFILALLGSSIGLYIRLLIPESLEYIMYYTQHPKINIKGILTQSLDYLYTNKLKSLYVFILSLLGVTTTFQIYIYGPTQAHLYKLFSDQQIILSNIMALITLLIVFPVVGKLSDKVNQERIIAYASVGFLVLIQPFFYVLSHGNYLQLVIIHSLISIPAAAYYATVPVMLTQMFPVNLRCTALSILYSTAASLAAGLTPLLSLILLRKTQYATSPAIITLLLAVISLLITMRLQVLKLVRSQKYSLI